MNRAEGIERSGGFCFRSNVNDCPWMSELSVLNIDT